MRMHVKTVPRAHRRSADRGVPENRLAAASSTGRASIAVIIRVAVMRQPLSLERRSESMWSNSELIL